MLMLDLRECGILNVAEVDTKIHRGMLFGSINPGDFTEAVVCVCVRRCQLVRCLRPLLFGHEVLKYISSHGQKPAAKRQKILALTMMP